METKKKINGIFARRKFRYGTLSTLLTIGFIVLVVLFNMAAGAIEDNWGLVIDASTLQASDLDEQTYEVLAGVTEPIKAYTVYQAATSNEMRIQIEGMLKQYAAKCDYLSYENLDPVTSPLRVKALAGTTDIAEGAVIFANQDETRVKIVNMADYYYQYSSSITSGSYTVFAAETLLTSAIVYVTADATANVYFLTGHSEPALDGNFKTLSAQLSYNNYNVQTVNLTSGDVKLAKGDTLVVIDPALDLSDDEYETVKTWLAAGGRLLMCVDYNVDLTKTPNFTKLLDYYQIGFGDGYVQEGTNSVSNWTGQTTYLVPNLDADHEITKTLSNYLLMPLARPIKPVAMPESGTTFTELLTTSTAASVVYEDGTNEIGQRCVALAMRQSKASGLAEDEIRIVLFGNGYALTDNLASSTYNITLGTNIIKWLANDQSTAVSISPDLIDTDSLVFTNNADYWTVTVLVVVALPLIAAIAGVVVWLRRRRL